MPLTKGHEQLIAFAEAYLDYENISASVLNIIISTRPNEPFNIERVDALQKHHHHKIYNHDDANAPQNPDDSLSEEEFWTYWKKTIIGFVGKINSDDILFASESYGIKLAEVLGCRFIPFNKSRDLIDISGTQIRKDPIKYFHMISPGFQNVLRQTITFFGPESCGKTTLSRRLAQKMNAHFVPEYARDYLEMVGENITTDKMYDIYIGQLTLQETSDKLKDKPFIFQDTDLLTTIYYYKLWPQYGIPISIYDDFKKTKSDLYILMNDKIPFEKDPLRYGGDKRKTNMQYWKNALIENDCKFHVMESISKKDQFFEAQEVINALFLDNAKPLTSFARF